MLWKDIFRKLINNKIIYHLYKTYLFQPLCNLVLFNYIHFKNNKLHFVIPSIRRRFNIDALCKKAIVLVENTLLWHCDSNTEWMKQRNKVYLCYPIWLHTMPKATFLEKNKATWHRRMMRLLVELYFKKKHSRANNCCT